MSEEKLAKEIAALRTEVEALRHQQAQSQTQSGQPKDSNPKKNTYNALNNELRTVLTTMQEQVKKEYDNVTPTSALLLFSLGVLFGRMLRKK